MSNVKILIVGDADVGLKYAPQGIWAAKKMRLDGHLHGASRSLPLGEVTLRVLLDDYTGDKCYIHTDVGGCPLIEYSGFLDTYPSIQSYPLGQPLRLQELQEDIEDLPRTRNGEDIDGSPKMYGIRKFPAYDSTKDPEPTLPPGYTLEATEYPKVSVPRQEQDDDFRRFFYDHKPTRYTGIMRRVLQCTFGTRTWADALTFRTAPGAPRQFVVNYKFGDSWGVILAPGKDGSLGSHYFLIWITAGEVFWVPASFCVHKVMLGTTEVFAPVLKSVQRTNVISIGIITYTGTSQHEVIGWSFSYTEPKASVVLYDYREPAAPMLFTALATLTVGFVDGVPGSVAVDVDTPSRLTVSGAPGRGAVQGLAYDPAGNLCIESFDSRGEGSVVLTDPIDAPVYVFYETTGSVVVPRYKQQYFDSVTETHVLPDTPVYWRNDGTTWRNDAVDVSGCLGKSDGTLFRGAYLSHSVVAAGVSSFGPTAPITDSRNHYSLGYDGYSHTMAGLAGGITDWIYVPYVLTTIGSSLWNLSIPGDYISSMVVRESGTRTIRDMDSVSSVLVFPEDREAVCVSSAGSRGLYTRAVSLTSLLVFKYEPHTEYYSRSGNYPAGKYSEPPTTPYELVISTNGATRGASFTYIGVEYPPYITYGVRTDSAVNSPAPPGYYVVGTWSLVNYPVATYKVLPVTATDPYPLYQSTATGSIPSAPTPAASAAATVVSMCKILTSGGGIDVASDTTFLGNCLRFWDPQAENSTWIPEILTSAYQPSEVFMRKHETIRGKVAKMGDAEYTVENSLYGWIGVV